MPENPERFPSARDIEKVARNPECQTLRTALAANIDVRKYAVEIGLEEDRQSPIALARGNQVERFVLGDSAARLVERLNEDAKVAPGAWVEDLGRRPPNRAGLQSAAEATDDFLSDLLESKSVPDILIHPVLSIQLGGDTQYIEPDALILYEGSSMYEAAELKSYPYRLGKTDPEDLRQARRQGAVYVLAQRRRIEALEGRSAQVPSQVTLIFTRPGSLFPAPIYHESVEGEMRDAEHAVSLLAEAKAELSSLLPPDGDAKALLPTLDIHYGERCLSFCSLAKRCREACSAAGQVAVLGEQSSRILAAAENVERAIELLQGAAPRDDGEAALAGRLRALASTVGEFKVAT